MDPRWKSRGRGGEWHSSHPVMKKWFSLVWLVFVSALARAGDKHLIIGDSLSKEYDVEGPGIGIDVFPPPSPYPKNWSELLDWRRADFFDYGDFDFHTDIRAAGHDYNWSVPGSYAREWRETYLAFPPGGLLSMLSQPQMKRVTIWLGGNDVRESYGDLYEGVTDPAAWALEVYGHIAFVLDWVMARRQPDVQVVLVNVAHLGATISKNRDHPYDVVKTGRVTAALDDLNARLSLYARSRGAALADIYRLTKELVTATEYCIGGWKIYKRTSSDGDTDDMFLSDGFHPNMPVQAIFAQIILDAYNASAAVPLPRLTNREIVDKCLEENPVVPFTTWMTNYGIAAAERNALADPDNDGVVNLVEFALDLDPVRQDAALLPQARRVDAGGQPVLTLSWQPRDLTNAAYCEITPQHSSALLSWTDIPAASVVSSSPNVRTVSVPAPAGQLVWLRLKVRQTAP